MSSKSILSPFSYEWIQLLEQFHNTFGHLNTSKDSDACLFPVPAFDCEPFIWHDAILDRNAYHLRPNDIKAVIAIGDSISAGFGMISGRPPFSTILEYRGKVFSVGGDKGEYTIPNYLSVWTNTSSRGPPTGYTLPLSRGKQLDNAVSGSKTQDLDEQISRLVYLLSTSKYKDVKDEWKLITLFIGANNVCVLCEPPITTLPGLAEADVFEKNVRQALTRIKNEVGKSFVNLVALFNVSSVYEASRGDPYSADRVVNEYNLRLEKLEKEFKHQDSMELGVSYQPGFKQFPVAKYKQSYFSGVDCFHPNKCANQLMSILLWNNMFSSKEEKNRTYDIESLEFICPSPQRPYIHLLLLFSFVVYSFSSNTQSLLPSYKMFRSRGSSQNTAPIHTTSSFFSGNASIKRSVAVASNREQFDNNDGIIHDEIIDLQAPEHLHDLTIESMSAVLAAAVQMSSAGGAPSSLSLGNASILQPFSKTKEAAVKRRFSARLLMNPWKKSSATSTSPTTPTTPGLDPSYPFDSTLDDDNSSQGSPRSSSVSSSRASNVNIDDGRDELLYRGIQIKEIKTTLKPLIISDEQRYPMPEVRLERPGFARINY
ncbi:hypothetical protein [Parasitella parasitica]|uniref:Uncharacterized protein n=1 Tax=Parasitella parasitica TaxID=35722 RepID=A0A0B7N057_9FUNG|nr:hypothetical protein [Parasitella parasitica]